MKETEKLKALINASDRIAFFGGAGVSTESGIPDFRSENGLYRQKFDYPPEVMLSHEFFFEHTEEFFDFYRAKMLALDILPNSAHYALAKLEEQGKMLGVVTQNIDGLHQKAGSKKVFELHGSVHRNYCTKCRKFYDARFIEQSKGIPKCTECGGIIKPDVVLYGETLDDTTVSNAVRAIAKASLLIVAGTSLAVYPAASLIRYFSGNALVLINKDATPIDGSADLVIHAPVGEVLKEAVLD